ncbi:unnamed protein product [Blepharisma stoltei]|uniref:Uncharacterized protein n=1 Tax=Blepharisma stoltei TaxID=1481888 RepID=A0AAU9JSQ1_9CILI|nr:unnamed protein product [Blepharisma stoltei]
MVEHPPIGSDNCTLCPAVRQWLFSVIGIYFTVNYIKSMPFPTWKSHIIGLVSPIIFYGAAYTQYLAKLAARRRFIEQSLQNDIKES